mmetsp:Transcript_93474/g.264347  ORF Transcript_93474/g.264347 Transcript_93474/m.264347 type:complete len:231 (+) Transcript_93474:2453-3145(+)
METVPWPSRLSAPGHILTSEASRSPPPGAAVARPASIWATTPCFLSLLAGRPDTMPCLLTLRGCSPSSSLLRKQWWVRPLTPVLSPHVQAPHSGLPSHSAQHISALPMSRRTARDARVWYSVSFSSLLQNLLGLVSTSPGASSSSSAAPRSRATRGRRVASQVATHAAARASASAAMPQGHVALGLRERGVRTSSEGTTRGTSAASAQREAMRPCCSSLAIRSGGRRLQG